MGTDDALVSSIDDPIFAYQIMTGVGMDFTEKVTFLVGYRYLGMGDVDFRYTGTSTDGSFSPDSHNIDFSLKYSF